MSPECSVIAVCWKRTSGGASGRLSTGSRHHPGCAGDNQSLQRPARAERSVVHRAVPAGKHRYGLSASDLCVSRCFQCIPGEEPLTAACSIPDEPFRLLRHLLASYKPPTKRPAMLGKGNAPRNIVVIRCFIGLRSCSDKTLTAGASAHTLTKHVLDCQLPPIPESACSASCNASCGAVPAAWVWPCLLSVWRQQYRACGRVRPAARLARGPAEAPAFFIRPFSYALC